MGEIEEESRSLKSNGRKFEIVIDYINGREIRGGKGKGIHICHRVKAAATHP